MTCEAPEIPRIRSPCVTGDSGNAPSMETAVAVIRKVLMHRYRLSASLLAVAISSCSSCLPSSSPWTHRRDRRDRRETRKWRPRPLPDFRSDAFCGGSSGPAISAISEVKRPSGNCFTCPGSSRCGRGCGTGWLPRRGVRGFFPSPRGRRWFGRRAGCGRRRVPTIQAW